MSDWVSKMIDNYGRIRCSILEIFAFIFVLKTNELDKMIESVWVYIFSSSFKNIK